MSFLIKNSLHIADSNECSQVTELVNSPQESLRDIEQQVKHADTSNY